MEALTVAQIKQLDTKARELINDERLLIENASSNLCTFIEQHPLGKNALVIAGCGNNGADVLSCSRKLISRGYTVSVVVITHKALNKECDFQKSLLETLGVTIHFLKRIEGIATLDELYKSADFIVEGVFGTGLRGDLAEFYQALIRKINEFPKTIVSCDIPSGLNADTGIIASTAVCATHTITFIAAKKGFFLERGPDVCGTIEVVDIGFSRELLGALVKKGDKDED